jgi:hypothetical protein
LSRRIHITVTDRQYEELVAEAIRTGRAQAQVARTALDAHLKRNEKRTFRGIEFAIFIRNVPRVLRRIHPRLGD